MQVCEEAFDLQLSREEQLVFSILKKYPRFSFSCKRITTMLFRLDQVGRVDSSSTHHVQKILRSLGNKGLVDIIPLASRGRGSRYKLSSVLFKEPRLIIMESFSEERKP